MRLCPSQLQLSLNPPDVCSVVAGGVRAWLLWEVTRHRLKWWQRWILCRKDSGKDEWSSGVMLCLCLWDGAMKISDWPGRSTHRQTLFFLMIKAQPEGQCSDVRHWYEHISLTFILTAEAKYCSPKCKSIKIHIWVFYYSSGRGFWLIFARLRVHNAQPPNQICP